MQSPQESAAKVVKTRPAAATEIGLKMGKKITTNSVYSQLSYKY